MTGGRNRLKDLHFWRPVLFGVAILGFLYNFAAHLLVVYDAPKWLALIHPTPAVMGFIVILILGFRWTTPGDVGRELLIIVIGVSISAILITLITKGLLVRQGYWDHEYYRFPFLCVCCAQGCFMIARRLRGYIELFPYAWIIAGFVTALDPPRAAVWFAVAWLLIFCGFAVAVPRKSAAAASDAAKS